MSFHPFSDLSSPSRVIMVCRNLPPRYSGAAIQAIELARGLRPIGVHSEFLTDNRSARTVSEEIAGNLICRLRTSNLGGELGKLSEALFALRALTKIACSQTKVVHFHGLAGYEILILPLLKVLGKRTIVELTLQGSDDPVSLRQRKLGWLFEPCLKTASVVVPISSRLEDLCLQAGFVRSQLCRIPVGVDLGRYKPADSVERKRLRGQFGWREDATVFLNVGRIEDRKAQYFILNSWTEIVQSLPGAMLVFAGPGNDEHNPYFRRLEGFIHERQLRGISFLGMVQDTSGLMRASDCLLHAAKNEGLPNTLVEAAVTGLPIVCRKIPRITSDIIWHSDLGAEVEGDDPTDFADEAVSRATSALTTDFEVQEATRQRFDIRQVAESYVGLYESRSVDHYARTANTLEPVDTASAVQ